jgi:hypothetical protein
MRLASYVPGELIPLPLSGSIPELPHVTKANNPEKRRVAKNSFRRVTRVIHRRQPALHREVGDPSRVAQYVQI